MRYHRQMFQNWINVDHNMIYKCYAPESISQKLEFISVDHTFVCDDHSFYVRHGECTVGLLDSHR